LNLSDTEVTDKHIDIMAEGDGLKNLEELYIKKCLKLSNDSIKHISGNKLFSNLRVFDISENPSFNHDAIKSLANS
jgi:hypothetical protein